MIESPCTNVCVVDADGICVGCRRTLDEIGAWAGASDDEKRAIIAAIGSRPLRPRR